MQYKYKRTQWQTRNFIYSLPFDAEKPSEKPNYIYSSTSVYVGVLVAYSQPVQWQTHTYIHNGVIKFSVIIYTTRIWPLCANTQSTPDVHKQPVVTDTGKWVFFLEKITTSFAKLLINFNSNNNKLFMKKMSLVWKKGYHIARSGYLKNVFAESPKKKC